jgi:hypothetical protein
MSGAVAVIVAAAMPALPVHAAGARASASATPAGDIHAAARALARSTGRAVTIDALTTEDSTTVANPDGTFSLTTTVLPTRMRNSAGVWENIDATLSRRADGSVSTRATANVLTLSGGGAGPLVSVADHSGHSLKLSLPVRLPAPVLSGASATYSNVFRGMDVVVTARPSGGFAEVFVVHDAAAASAAAGLRFTTSLRGLALRDDGFGNLQAVDTVTGRAVMTAPPAAVWDSATTGGASADAPESGTETTPASSWQGPGRGAHAARLPIAVDGGGLSLGEGPAALPTATPTYPIYLDPTWSLPFSDSGKMNYDEIQSGCPTAKYYDNVSQPGVGYNDFESCIGRFRSFYQVNTSGLASNFVIVSSTLKINEVFSAWDSCGQGSETIAVKWTGLIGTGTDWDHPPSVDSRGDPITTKNLKSVGNSNGKMCTGGVVPGDFDMKEAIVKVAAGNFDNLTFGLYGNETPGSHSLERFNNNPHIDTVYDIPPDTPSNLTATPAPVDSTGAVDQGCGSAAAGYLGISNLGGQHVATLSATLTSDISQAQMHGIFTIHDDTTNTTVATPTGPPTGFVTTGAKVSVQTPTLADGHQYSWSLYSDDQYFDSSQSTTCRFIVDQTAPLNPAVTSTDFPPSGSGIPSTKTNGQSGTLNLTSSDPNPSGGTGSGMKGFRFSLDTPIPSSGAPTTPSTGSLTVTITPAQWGTHTFYAEAVDNAGNVSGQVQYSFYVPWNPGTAVQPGDINGDGKPDLLGPTSAGNLVAYLGNSDPAAAPLLLSTAAASPDLLNTSWTKFLVTHRGSFTNQGVDDLWAYATVTHGLYLYKNFGSSPFQNTGNVVPITKQEVVTDANTISIPTPDSSTTACHSTTPGSCMGYDNSDWGTVSQILAPGDLYAGTANDNGAPGLLTVEGGSLWYYQGQTTPSYIGTAIQLGTSGWNNVTLLAPGTVSSKPTLWARDNSTGAILQYTITFDAHGFPVNLGTPSSGTPLTIPGGATLTPALYPAIASPGDLRGSGNPDLVVATPSGQLIDYPGTTPTSVGLAMFGSPVTLGVAPGIITIS